MDLMPPPGARVIPLGQPIDEAEALFEGALDEARRFVADLTPAQRDAVAIWTPGHVFTAAELAAETPGHEHDPR